MAQQKIENVHEEIREEQVEVIDFKMVTFALAGKDYGIDIMKVKEISKSNKFTYVPNTAPFVRGVHNLRGDIISIIDLRTMFHLPAEQKKDTELENMLILRMYDHILGIIVDSIDKVVGVSKASIQPPHPIFGDINIKYISGVVENNNRLYIILDVDRIFSKEKDEKEQKNVFEDVEQAMQTEMGDEEESREEDIDLSFIAENLSTFKNFHLSSLNHDWMLSRYQEWKNQRASRGADLQLKSVEEAEEYLEPFYSSYTGRLWGKDLMEAYKDILPDVKGNTVTVWNCGSGKGYETYSFACVLKERYPEKRIKIYANDVDLLSISTAPSLVLQENEVPENFDKYVRSTKNGLVFNDEIKEMILFEYHDILNGNAYSMVDFIIARDVLSFVNVKDQKRLLSEFNEKLKKQGLLFLGENEKITEPDAWTEVRNNKIVAYKKQSE
ncbi:MAG: CheR family methyltransferase [Spirochaetia bacterium]